MSHHALTADLPASLPRRVAIIGAGPAGLMAAEALSAGGDPALQVEVYDAMASAGRKFLLAGKGGLNLTHAEANERFIARYDDPAGRVAGWLDQLSPQGLRDWAAGLGVSTFVGSSGKVFPAEMKAAPLLRAWLHRLRGQGVRFHMRHRWTGLLERCETADGDGTGVTANGLRQGWRLAFESRAQAGASAVAVNVEADAVLLALGGASWPQLGSDGTWQPWLAGQGVGVEPLVASNCGFDVGWSAYLARRFAGTPLKNLGLRFTDVAGAPWRRLGEAVLTATGLEGNLIYAASGPLRRLIERDGRAEVALDLLPAKTEAVLAEALARGRGARSFPNHLREATGLHGAAAALLREGLTDEAAWRQLQQQPAALAARIKALPVVLNATRPVAEAISSAGGVQLADLDAGLQCHRLPGVWCAGEMLDWDAPTGGYLLTASLASGRVAGFAMRQQLIGQSAP